jgi:hypothetical protein
MRFRVAGFVLSLLVLAAPAGAEGREPVDLELALAVDVSGSIDREEAELQRDGYLKALLDPRVLQAIAGGQRKRIAVTYFEWASYGHQRLVVDWTAISGRPSAEAFVKRLAAAPITTERWTSISGALEFAMKSFDANPYRGPRRVIDISGDGRNNNGRDLGEARAEALARGIVINGLPIVNDRPTRRGTPPERDLDLYYRDHVIGGPDAFYIVADGFQSFAAAIRTKLVREIALRPEIRGAPATPCCRLLALRPGAR